MGTIGQRIRSRREELDMSQDELAKRTGYRHRSSINKIETGRELPMRKVEVFAKALDTSVSYLMGWETDMKSLATYIGSAATGQTILSPEELEMMRKFRLISPEAKETVTTLIDTFYEKYKKGNEKSEEAV